jgi:AAA15 family ATPase/GTPase
MLSNLSLQNIKSFNKEATLKIAPITLIYGPNSSGKSSLWKFFLALKNSLEPKNNGLTMKQMMGYFKRSKGDNKMYWKGRTDAFRG